MISSKELIDQTGISRATLNNYIAMGLIPRPLVSAPGHDEESRARQLGYFPDSAVERVAHIQRLKKEGFTMAEIVSRLASEASREGTTLKGPAAGAPVAAPLGEPPRLTVEGIAHPAFMVNYNFEVTWFNRAAQNLFLGPDAELPPTSDGRNLFRLLLTQAQPERNRLALLRFHLSLAKERISKTMLMTFCHGVGPDRMALLDRMYRRNRAGGSAPDPRYAAPSRACGR